LKRFGDHIGLTYLPRLSNSLFLKAPEGVKKMEEKKKTNELIHQLTLVGRGQLVVEGVMNLGSYDQDQVILETNSGILEVRGDALHIQQLSLDQGKVMIDGNVYSLVYSDENGLKKGKGLLGRLIK
jgi:sporulation protein YabP